MPPPGVPTTVLIISADAVLRTTLRQWLEYWALDLVCLEASTIALALPRVRAGGLDCIVLDVEAPNVVTPEDLATLQAAIPPDTPPVPVELVPTPRTLDVGQFRQRLVTQVDQALHRRLGYTRLLQTVQRMGAGG